MERKYYQIRELDAFYDVERANTDGRKKETARQFLLTQSVAAYLSLHNAPASLVSNADIPGMNQGNESLWQLADTEESSYPFLLTGWFKLSKESLTGIAHFVHGFADVTRTGMPEGFVGEFVIEDVPICDFLDLWLEADDFERLRRSVCPEQAMETEKPLGTKERRTLLAVIGVLCSENNIDLSKPSKAAGIVSASADRQGIKISQRSLENHFKAVHEAIRSRQ